jgi:hypothetical protein
MIEAYESFVWTERYSDSGEIQIISPSTPQNRNLMSSGTFIGLSESKRVMKVETIQDAEGEDGSNKLTISGREISDIMYDRVAASGFVGTEPGTWKAVGKPSDVIRSLFDYVCRLGTADATDKLPMMVAGSMYADGNLPEETASYTMERTVGPLYNAIKELADVWDLGFRLYKGQDNGKLFFNVYKGSDRTAGQSTLPSVIFSPDLDTLQSVSELTSVSKSKNVALVSNERMKVTVYSDGASENTTGFDKRTLYVSDTSTMPTGTMTAEQNTAMIAAMTQLGREELAKNRSISAFDGEITQLSPYKYGRDYNLGDLVEMRNSDGLTNQMLVTEQIFAADETGERAYPTLTIKLFITPGSWLAWENTQTWVNAPGIWDDA